MCDLFNCFQKYKCYANVLSSHIVTILQKYCDDINPNKNNDVWKPIINEEIIFILSNMLKRVCKKNRIPVSDLHGNFTDYVSAQIAYYIFNTIIDNNVNEFNLCHVSNDNVFNFTQTIKINTNVLERFKIDFYNIHGRIVDLNTTFVIDKYFLDSKFSDLFTTTVKNIDYNDVFMKCYNEFNKNTK